MNNEKSNNKKPIIIFIALALVVVALLCILFVPLVRSVKTYKSITEIEQIMGMPIVVLSSQSEIKSQAIVEKKYAEVKYVVKGVNFTVRASRDKGVDILQMDNEWDPQYIRMDVDCIDGTILSVISYRALGNKAIIQSQWEEDGVFYTAISTNADSTEVFLQEIYRLVKENHNKVVSNK